MAATIEQINRLAKHIEQLGYEFDFGSSNPDKPNQQLWIYKKDKKRPIAKVSLILACRVNTMQNGIGREDKQLLKLLTQFSITL